MDTRPIRILHVIGRMDLGGAETLIMNLYRHIDRNNVQFDFVENTEKAAAFDSEIRSLGGRIYHCPHYNGKNHFAYVKWWDRFFKEHAAEYAAVHGHLGSTAAIYLRTAKKYGLHTIAHSHNTKGVGFGDLIYRAYAFPTRFIADRFFACSRAAGIDRYGKKVGADPERCIVLHNSIDTKHFAYDPRLRAETRAKLNVSDEELLIGHIGRFVPQKNHTFLIDIFSEVCKIHENSKLLLLGKEDAAQTVRRKVETLGLTDRVILAGVQNDTSPYYQAMDVFALPSLFEGLPVVMVEAQTAGLPCIISDKTPEACILNDELVTVCELSDCAERWAACILEKAKKTRIDGSEVIAANAFDIRQTAKWLEDYYCSMGKKQ